MKRFLAIDLGASGGRGIVGEYENGKIELCEIHRFESCPALMADGWHWDIAEILRQIKLAMKAAAAKYGKNGIDSMGIDSWGVDYGLLDKNGALLQLPFHYRDTRTDKYIPEIEKVISRRELYGINGLQFMNFNTVYQLYSHFHECPYLYDAADTFLMIPQLLGYLLTGEKCAEYSLASTTGLLDAEKRDWDFSLMKKLGIPEKIFPKISEAGTVLGRVKKEFIEETGLDVNVVNVASHDTASAFSSVPYDKGENIYISSGTWSLMGVLADAPVINDESYKINFTNEGSPEGKIRFLRNIMGMWLIQQTRRIWNADGKTRNFTEITENATNISDNNSYIDPDYKPFGEMCNMPFEVKKYCEEKGEKVPETEGEIARCIFESLALKYRENTEKLEALTKKNYDAIQIVGGGIQNRLMCQLTANACGKRVITGPVEATAMGNLLLQIKCAGDIKSISEGRKIVLASDEITVYEPEDTALWEKKYADYKKVISK